jgi:hypothetical protein
MKKSTVFCAIAALGAILSLMTFLYLIKISGGPDHGQEVTQFILPIILHISLLSFLIGYVLKSKNKK